MDYNDTYLLQQADDKFNHGMDLRYESQYDDAIMEYKKCLWLREFALGRYDKDTSSVYDWLGYCYYMKGDIDNAIMTYHTWLHIERYLTTFILNTDSSTNLSSSSSSLSVINLWTAMKHSLEIKGLSNDEIELYDCNVSISTQTEKDGDLYRKNGEYNEAILKYHEAILIEMECIGSDITLAYLWRKVAYVIAKKEDFMKGKEEQNDKVKRHLHRRYNVKSYHQPTPIIWTQMDRIDINETNENDYNLSNAIFHLIQNGDKSCGKWNFQQAVEYYQNVFAFVCDNDKEFDTIRHLIHFKSNNSNCNNVARMPKHDDDDDDDMMDDTDIDLMNFECRHHSIDDPDTYDNKCIVDTCTIGKSIDPKMNDTTIETDDRKMNGLCEKLSSCQDDKANDVVNALHWICDHVVDEEHRNVDESMSNNNECNLEHLKTEMKNQLDRMETMNTTLKQMNVINDQDETKIEHCNTKNCWWLPPQDGKIKDVNDDDKIVKMESKVKDNSMSVPVDLQQVPPMDDMKCQISQLRQNMSEHVIPTITEHQQTIMEQQNAITQTNVKINNVETSIMKYQNENEKTIRQNYDKIRTIQTSMMKHQNVIEKQYHSMNQFQHDTMEHLNDKIDQMGFNIVQDKEHQKAGIDDDDTVRYTIECQMNKIRKELLELISSKNIENQENITNFDSKMVMLCHETMDGIGTKIHDSIYVSLKGVRLFIRLFVLVLLVIGTIVGFLLWSGNNKLYFLFNDDRDDICSTLLDQIQNGIWDKQQHWNWYDSITMILLGIIMAWIPLGLRELNLGTTLNKIMLKNDKSHTDKVLLEPTIKVCDKVHQLLEDGEKRLAAKRERIDALEEAGKYNEASYELRNMVEMESTYLGTIRDGFVDVAAHSMNNTLAIDTIAVTDNDDEEPSVISMLQDKTDIAAATDDDNNEEATVISIPTQDKSDTIAIDDEEPSVISMPKSDTDTADDDEP